MTVDAIDKAGTDDNPIIIGLEDKVPLWNSIVYGVQHIVAMFAGIVAVPLIVGSAIHLPPDQKTILVQACLLASGIGTILQTSRIWFIGARLPICMGTAFVFITPMIMIGNVHGVAGIIGGLMIGGLAEFIVAPYIWRIKHVFPPLVTGTVIALIGLSLIPVGFRWMAGGFGDLYGKPVAYVISGSVLIIMIGANRFASGYIRTVSVIIAVVAGYIIAGAFGLVDFSVVGRSSWFAPPRLFSFGAPTFSVGAIVGILVAQFGNMLETIGNTFATNAVLNNETEPAHLRGAIAVDGIGSFIGAVFGGFSITSFAQNIGVIGLTGVGSRRVVRVAGVILVLMALFPKLAAVIVAMPDPVLGGAGIVMFGAIVAAGVHALIEEGMDQRDMTIFATAISVGLGCGLAGPEAFAAFPQELQIILRSGIVMGSIIVIAMNLLLPTQKKTDNKTASTKVPIGIGETRA